MNIVNAFFKKPANDRRTALHARQTSLRAVRSPYGNFRSVALLRDIVMTQHPGFWIDLVGEGLPLTTIARRVYYRIYNNCLNEKDGWSFE